MATEQKDFKVKKGIIVTGNISHSTGGFVYDATANTLNLGGSAVGLQSSIDLVQNNVATNASSILTVRANVGTTYNTLNGRINTVQGNLTSTVANVGATYNTLNGRIDTVQSNVDSLTTTVSGISSTVDTNTGRLDSLKYFRTVTANGVSLVAGSNADSMSIIAGDGITLIGDAGAKTIAIHVDGASDVNTVQDNVTALASAVDGVQANVYAITDGTTAFTGDVTFQQDVIIDGDLIVGGTTTSIASIDTTITDRTITLSNGAVSASFDTGILMSRGSSSNVFMGWDESADRIVLGYTLDEGSNVVTDYSFSSYVDLEINNLIVTGTVDGVDIAAANTALQVIESDLVTISSNTVTNENRLNSLVYYNTIQVSGQTDVVASANADVLTVAAGTGISITTGTDSITISSTAGTGIDLVQDNVTINASNISSNLGKINLVSSNTDSVASDLADVIDGTTPFTGPVTFNSTISATVAELGSVHVTSNTLSSIGSADTEVFTFPGSVYRGAELTILTQDISNSEYQINKMLIVHDGEDLYFTEYGIVYTGTGELTNFNATLDVSDVISVRASGGSANKKISIASHNLIQ